MPAVGKKLVRPTARVRKTSSDSGATRTRRGGSAPAAVSERPRLIDPGPPPEWRFAGLTVVIAPERAELRYARERVGSASPRPDAILEAVARARRRLEARSREPGELLPALAAAYAVLLGRRAGRPGDRVPLVELRDQLADRTRAQFAWDIARLRRERRLVVDGRRLDLGVAVGHEAQHRSRVVWIENEGGGGSYFASFRLIPQEARS
jgi:hypothetical protein